jgi:hypothetical protein
MFKKKKGSKLNQFEWYENLYYAKAFLLKRLKYIAIHLDGIRIYYV